MFFRHQTVKTPTFSDYLDKARKAGFTVEPLNGSTVRISRNGIAADVQDVPGGPPKIVHRAGVLMGSEIATLVDAGYQKFLQTPSGKRRPALARDLKAIHEFQEDLREALGLVSLYNESLGTVSNQYIYDRVEERDTNEPKDAWKIATPAKTKA
jgi:hypothetical protein